MQLSVNDLLTIPQRQMEQQSESGVDLLGDILPPSMVASGSTVQLTLVPGSTVRFALVSGSIVELSPPGSTTVRLSLVLNH